MNQSSALQTGLVLVGITVLGVVTHLLPHDMGFTTVGAVGMLAAAYLPRALMPVPVLITVIAADLMIGAYGFWAMAFVYLGHASAALAVGPVLRRIRPSMVFAAALVNAVVFYLISNITPMVMGFYPPTLEGWWLCYANGIPFLLRGIAANLAFGSLFFGLIWLVRYIRAHRLAAAQRH